MSECSHSKSMPFKFFTLGTAHGSQPLRHYLGLGGVVFLSGTFILA